MRIMAIWFTAHIYIHYIHFNGMLDDVLRSLQSSVQFKPDNVWCGHLRNQTRLPVGLVSGNEASNSGVNRQTQSISIRRRNPKCYPIYTWCTYTSVMARLERLALGWLCPLMLFTLEHGRSPRGLYPKTFLFLMYGVDDPRIPTPFTHVSIWKSNNTRFRVRESERGEMPRVRPFDVHDCCFVAFSTETKHEC